MDEGLWWLYRLSFFRQGQLVDFNCGKVSDRRGLGTVGLLRGGLITEDAAAGSAEAFSAEFGYFSPVRLSRSRPICGACGKDPPLPAVPGGRSSRQGHRGRGAQATGSPSVVQDQRQRVAVTLSLAVTCTQVVAVWSWGLSQTVHTKQALEGFLKLLVRTWVDDGINAAVEVTKPEGDLEHSV